MKKARMFKTILVLTVVFVMLIASATMASAANYGLLNFDKAPAQDATIPAPVEEVVDPAAPVEEEVVDPAAPVVDPAAEEEVVEEEVVEEEIPEPSTGAFKIMSYMWATSTATHI